MASKGHALSRDELVRALVAKTGITTTDGATPGNNTLVDSALIGWDARKIIEKTILISSGDSDTEDAAAVSFAPGSGTITVSPAFSHQILAGTVYRIINISTVEMDVITIAANVLTILADLTDAGFGLAALKALIDAIEGKLDGASGLVALKAVVDAILVDTGTTLPATLAIIAGYIDTEVAAIKAQTDKIAGKMLFEMDFWSDPQEEVQVAQAAGTVPITPTITIAGLPAGFTVARATPMFKFRMAENAHATLVNSLDGSTNPNTSQVIQVKRAGGTFIDAINFVDDQFSIAAATREGGDVVIGSIDVKTQVNGNVVCSFQWLLAKANQDFLNFNDVQVGLRIWYSV